MRYLNFKKSLLSFLFLCFLICPSFSLAQIQEPCVTNSFFETDIREALRDISAQTGERIVADETVQGTISIELKEVPLEEALRMILSVGNYTFRKMPDGYYLVGLCTPNSPSFSRLSVTDYFHPSYLKVKELQSLISEFYSPYIQVNEDVNIITITASPEIAKRIKEDLTKFDRAPRQVMIEALVIELSEEGKKSLGVTWGAMLEGGFSVYPPSTLDYQRTAGKGNWELSGTLSTDLLLRINTLVSEGKAKVRANPRVATLEGRQAEISIGREEYFLINVATGATAYYTLQSVATGVVLKIIPYVDSDSRQITVNISPQVSEVATRTTSNLPVVTKRTATTSLRVNDGQTIAIGGLVQEQTSETISRVPILGSLPILGMLFRTKKVSAENKEVVIFITPRIIGEQTGLEKADQREFSQMDFSEEKDPVKRYYLQISKIIDSHKKFPDLLKDSQDAAPKELLVKIIVFSNGTVGKVEVIKASDLPLLDLIAAKMIENISPFPPFPKELKQPSITFVIPIRYEP